MKPKTYEEYCRDKNVKRPYPEYYDEYCRGFLEAISTQQPSPQSDVEKSKRSVVSAYEILEHAKKCIDTTGDYSLSKDEAFILLIALNTALSTKKGEFNADDICTAYIMGNEDGQRNFGLVDGQLIIKQFQQYREQKGKL